MSTLSCESCITCKNIAENPNRTPAEARVLSCCEEMHNAEKEFNKFLNASSFEEAQFDSVARYPAAQKRLRTAKAAAAKVSPPEQVAADGVPTLVDGGDSAAAVTAAGAAVGAESAAAAGAAVAVAKAVPVGGVDAAAAGAAMAVPVPESVDAAAAVAKLRA